jgi:hypothetical protein
MGITSCKYRGEYDKQLAVYSQTSGGIRNEGADDNTLILYNSKITGHGLFPSVPVCKVGVVVPSAYYQLKE